MTGGSSWAWTVSFVLQAWTDDDSMVMTEGFLYLAVDVVLHAASKDVCLAVLTPFGCQLLSVFWARRVSDLNHVFCVCLAADWIRTDPSRDLSSQGSFFF